MEIIGRVVYKNISGGFWGIIDNKGQKWRLVNLPKDLQKEGEVVTINAKLVDEVSVFMWGNAIKVI
jgi:hypothetical protein